MKVFSWEIRIVEFLQTKRDTPWIELCMRWLSDMNLAIIFGAIVFLWLTRNHNLKSRVFYLGCIGICLLISDPLSHRVIKILFERPRPFYLISGCHSRTCWGFISSHATNIASIGAFFSFSRPKAAIFFIPLYVLVSFSRMYLNKHFPLDVLGGGFLGITIGYCIFKLSQLLKRRWKSLEAI